MAPTTIQSGKIGEAAAEKFYLSRGYTIIARNYSVKGGEIDLVAFRCGTLVFIEVKSRSSNKFGAPSDAVDQSKIYHLHTAQRQFLYDNMRGKKLPIYSKLLKGEIYRRIFKMRCDIAEVYLAENNRINIIKNAFEVAEI